MRFLDQWLASDAERQDAATRATEAVRDHGAGAAAYLRRKLDDPRRRRSRRAIRMALASLAEEAASSR